MIRIHRFRVEHLNVFILGIPVLTLLGLLNLCANPCRAQNSDSYPAGDELVVAGIDVLSFAPLPVGPARSELLQLTLDIRELTYLSDGRLLAARLLPASGASAERIVLAEILPDGQVVDIGLVDRAEDAILGEGPLDLAIDGSGRLFLLTGVAIWWNPPDGYSRLVELDPNDASTISSRALDWQTDSIATAPRGLWALSFGQLRLLDPDTGQFREPMIPLPPVGGNDAVVDSTGALWISGEGLCSPSCYFISRLDPQTGASAPASAQLNPGLLLQDLAVRRRCIESDTARCLLGGRFRAEVAWKDSANRQGAGHPTPARSADSAVFWFFGPANWELMVKVLDGCSVNDRFWVFASGSTDVEYSLTVTDLETGSVQRYDNALGEIAQTVTDTAAFECQ